MFWFIILLLIVGGCFYLYQKLMEIEREIRTEQETDQTAKVETVQKPSDDEDVVNPPIVTPEVENLVTKAEAVVDESLSLEDEILNAVKNVPGVKQTELYDSFSDINKKRLQQLLKDMDDSGQVRREKKGSSYLLYPV